MENGPTPMHTAEGDDLISYRAFSLLAVLALLLGLLSPLALLHPLVWSIPVVAIAVSLYALRHIRKEELAGRPAALLGLVLALFFLAWAPVRMISRDFHLYSQGRQFANEWFSLLAEGKRHEAHQLHLPSRQRQSPGASLEKFYADSKEAGEALQQFYSTPFFQEALRENAACRFDFVRNVAVSADAQGELIMLDYRLACSEGKPKEIRVFLRRNLETEHVRRALWRVESVDFLKAEK